MTFYKSFHNFLCFTLQNEKNDDEEWEDEGTFFSHRKHHRFYMLGHWNCEVSFFSSLDLMPTACDMNNFYDCCVTARFIRMFGRSDIRTLLKVFNFDSKIWLPTNELKIIFLLTSSIKIVAIIHKLNFRKFFLLSYLLTRERKLDWWNRCRPNSYRRVAWSYRRFTVHWRRIRRKLLRLTHNWCGWRLGHARDGDSCFNRLWLLLLFFRRSLLVKRRQRHHNLVAMWRKIFFGLPINV